MFKKISKIFATVLGITLMVPMVITLSSCSAGNSKVYVANFQSYISPDLKNEIEKNNNADFKFFSSNEQAKREFTRNHHISIPSSYVSIELIKVNQVEPIDWAKLTDSRILNANQALDYFTDNIIEYLTSQDLNGNGTFDDLEDNLLYWSLPYFAQDLIVGYKAEESFLDEYDLPQAMEVLGQQVGKNKQFNRITMVDDVRTIFGFSKRMDGSNNINPEGNDETIDYFKNMYAPLKNNFGDNKVIFNTDSNVILNDFAADNGSDVIVSYNGDMLYATYGGDSGTLPEKPMQIYRPEGDSIAQALELVVVNQDLYQKLNNEQQDNIWDIMAKVAFDLPTEIYEEDGDEIRLDWTTSWSYINFDYVSYTPVIKGLYEFLLFENEISDEEDKRFDELQLEIFKIREISRDLIDSSINNNQQFNMQLAYMETKSEM